MLAPCSRAVRKDAWQKASAQAYGTSREWQVQPLLDDRLARCGQQ